jgi:hypothetical protein
MMIVNTFRNFIASGSVIYTFNLNRLVMRYLLCLVILLLPYGLTAQLYGAWKYCGTIRAADYRQPSPIVNADSLKFMFTKPDTGVTWTFNADGTALLKSPLYSPKSLRFSIREKDAALLLSGRKRNPLYIIYLDDSFLILWHNNPHWAELNMYRR